MSRGEYQPSAGLSFLLLFYLDLGISELLSFVFLSSRDCWNIFWYFCLLIATVLRLFAWILSPLPLPYFRQMSQGKEWLQNFGSSLCGSLITRVCPLNYWLSQKLCYKWFQKQIYMYFFEKNHTNIRLNADPGYIFSKCWCMVGRGARLPNVKGLKASEVWERIWLKSQLF